MNGRIEIQKMSDAVPPLYNGWQLLCMGEEHARSVPIISPSASSDPTWPFSRGMRAKLLHLAAWVHLLLRQCSDFGHGVHKLS